MKPTSSCDVEISFTMDGMETVEPVPECLQEMFLSNTLCDTCPAKQNDVILPERYAQLISTCSECEKERKQQKFAEDKISDRERDLGTALDWIKQEIVIMKEQDKEIMKQFVTLRSKLLQLRCLYEVHSSNSDLSLDDSVLSLDDSADSADYLDTSGIEVDYRSRSSSLLVTECPISNGPVTRIRWKSNEYL